MNLFAGQARIHGARGEPAREVAGAMPTLPVCSHGHFQYHCTYGHSAKKGSALAAARLELLLLFARLCQTF